MSDSLHNGEAFHFNCGELGLSGSKLLRVEGDRPVKSILVGLAKYCAYADIQGIGLQSKGSGLQSTVSEVRRTLSSSNDC